MSLYPCEPLFCFSLFDLMVLCCSYQASDLVKLDILLNGQPVDAMATIVHNQKAQRIGRELVGKLKNFIERSSYQFFFLLVLLGTFFFLGYVILLTFLFLIYLA